MKRHGQLILTMWAYYSHYVLIKTDVPNEVLKVILDSNRFPLLKRDDFMTHISEAEGKLMADICEKDDCVELSVIRKKKDEAGRSRAEFVSGPLAKVEEHVKVVDFTKRKAYLHEGFQMYFLYERESREELITDDEFWKY